MHIVFTIGALTIAIIVGGVWIIGVAIGHNAAKRKAEKMRLKMEAKQARIAARAERRIQIRKNLQNFITWRRP